MKHLFFIALILTLLSCDKTADPTVIEYRVQFTGICDAQGDCRNAVLVEFESEEPATFQIEGVLPSNVCLVQYSDNLQVVYENIQDRYYDAKIRTKGGLVGFMVSLNNDNLPTNGDYTFFGDWYSRVFPEIGYKWRQVYSNCKD